MTTTDKAALIAEIAQKIRDFSWTLPLYDSDELNKITDDVACSIQDQIADYIAGLEP